MQQRSQETVRALVQAAARLLVEEGYHSLTTNRIAHLAGVSIGSLYQYFPSKEALCAAVIDWRLAQDFAVVEALSEAPPEALRERLLTVVDHICDHQREGAALVAALLPLLGHLERQERARQLVVEITTRLHPVLIARPELLRPDLRDPEALEIALFVLGRTLRWATNEAAAERPALLVDPRFRAELRRHVAALFA